MIDAQHISRLTTYGQLGRKERCLGCPEAQAACPDVGRWRFVDQRWRCFDLVRRGGLAPLNTSSSHFMKADEQA